MKPKTQGVPSRGPITLGQGRTAEHMVQVAWNAQHQVPWHWPVPAYLVTKGIGAGAFLVYALGLLTGLLRFDANTFLLGGLIGVAGTALTTALLVYDLERPERFLRILFRPQWKSWLVKGAYLLIAFSLVSTTWWAWEGAHWLDMTSAPPRTILAWLTVPTAIGAAVYTAFLFAQAEGRDLWQSPLLPPHLLVQAMMLGAAVFVALGAPHAKTLLFVTLGLDLALTLFGEFGVAHPSEVASRAAHAISHGKHAKSFWFGSVGLGHLVPAGLLLVDVDALAIVAALCVAVGLYRYEFAFVMAPQELPNS